MREFKYGVGVIATIFLLNLLLVKLSEKSSTKTDFWGKNQKDMSHDGTLIVVSVTIPQDFFSLKPGTRKNRVRTW